MYEIFRSRYHDVASRFYFILDLILFSILTVLVAGWGGRRLFCSRSSARYKAEISSGQNADSASFWGRWCKSWRGETHYFLQNYVCYQYCEFWLFLGCPELMFRETLSKTFWKKGNFRMFMMTMNRMTIRQQNGILVIFVLINFCLKSFWICIFFLYDSVKFRKMQCCISRCVIRDIYRRFLTYSSSYTKRSLVPWRLAGELHFFLSYFSVRYFATGFPYCLFSDRK